MSRIVWGVAVLGLMLGRGSVSVADEMHVARWIATFAPLAQASATDSKPEAAKPAETKPADAKPDPKDDPKDAKPLSGSDGPSEIKAGHSAHGETFNEGPRQKARLMTGTGRITFPCSSEVEEARKFVEQGIGQVHGFWYFEAERSFRQAAALDPQLAIAYWGMSLANVNNPTRAKNFLKEAVKRIEKASPLEKRFIEIYDRYLNHKGNANDKAKGYVADLEKLAEEYPDCLEAKAFLSYALYDNRSALKKDNPTVEKAIKRVLESEPMHPVHHYNIHLWDNPDPAKALGSSALCGQAAADIAHMWHMPGHIYSRLKRYEDAVWQQEASARVDHAQMMRDRYLPDQIHNFAHNNEWLIRNLVFLGKWQSALDLAKNMTELPQHPKFNTYARRGSAGYGRMRLFEVLSTFELWEELISLADQSYLEATDRDTEQVKRLRYLGIAHARLGDRSGANKVVAELKTRLAAEQKKHQDSLTQPAATTTPPSGNAKPATTTPPAGGKPADAKPAETKSARTGSSAESEFTGDDADQDVEPLVSSVALCDEPKTEASKPETPKTETPKPETPKPETPKSETPKAEPAKSPMGNAPAAKPGTPATKPTPAANKPAPKGPPAIIAEIDRAIAAVEGYLKVLDNDFDSALALLRKATGEDSLYLAKLQCLIGDVDGAVKAAQEFIKTQENRTVPYAGYVELLWLADRPDEARKAFDQLRAMSNSIEFGSPVFSRLAPLAKKFGYPDDWRTKRSPSTDVGTRPTLESLGPFRWAPSPAHPWTLRDVKGTPHSLSSYQGKPVVVIFYLGSGCLHCAEQLQKFAAAKGDFDKAGLSLIAVSTDSQEFLKISIDNYPGGMPFPLVSDEKMDVFKHYRAFDDFENKPLHGTYLIDPQGRVRWQDIGFEPFMDPNFVIAEYRRQTGSKSSTSVKESLLAKATYTLPTPVVPKLKAIDLATELRTVRANGIDGAVVLTNGTTLAEEPAKAFLELSHKRKAKIVVLVTQDKGGISPAVKTLLDQWQTESGLSWQSLRTGGADAAGYPELKAALSQATGVWIDGPDAAAISKLLGDGSMRILFRDLFARHGVVGGGPALARVASAQTLPTDDKSAATRGLGWLPGIAVAPRLVAGQPLPALAKTLAAEPRLVGIDLAPESTLIVRGRVVSYLGTQPSTIKYAASKTHPDTEPVLDSAANKFADVTALRRLAQQRLQPLFPGSTLDKPNVEKGTLIIVGGGGTPTGLYEKFIEAAGGKNAIIAIIPISTPDPLPEPDRFAEGLKKLGAKEVVVLKGRTPEEVDKPESLNLLKRATGVWFGGGRQWRFVDAYEGTQAEKAIHDVLKRGGVIAGSSAGASIQGDYLARGNPLGPQTIMAPGYERGMGFLKGTAIDQHFSARNRFKDLESVVDKYPQLLGIGIDEATALIVKGHVADVIGKGKAFFYDRTPDRPTADKVHEIVTAGGQYDLAARKVLNPGSETATSTTPAASTTGDTPTPKSGEGR